jgi:predicted nucleotidyltransferase
LVEMVNRQGHRQRYEDLEGGAEQLTVAGVRVRVAGLEDIIASKEHPGRPEDREAHRALPAP